MVDNKSSKSLFIFYKIVTICFHLGNSVFSFPHGFLKLIFVEFMIAYNLVKFQLYIIVCQSCGRCTTSPFVPTPHPFSPVATNLFQTGLLKAPDRASLSVIWKGQLGPDHRVRQLSTHCACWTRSRHVPASVFGSVSCFTVISFVWSLCH